MLFNSFVFLLGFLPLALALHWLVERFAPAWRLPLLAALSFAFYGWWDWRFVPLLAFSILLNWLIAEAFLKTKRRMLITLAIAINLAILALFKYFNFFAGLAAMIPGLPTTKLDLALPLGISFFTFHHVMYLTDLRRGEAPRYDLVRYALYIAFFPQVLAGPLVRWREIMHQFEERPYLRPDAAERVARGIMLLTIGLAKKVLIGDPLSEYANPVFAAAAAGEVVSMAQAWQGTLAFTFQIYFDFSGYTDMALGLALLFGIVLPQNFDVPYRATSLQDFWRRWHMTLSRFLRDYLYIPLGGSRHGLPLQLWALFATMALGGLWHGAGLNFVAWGAAHGVVLAIGVLWRRAGLPMPKLLGWALTFLFVAFCWVLFRATSFDAALAVYKGMLGFGPIGTGFKWRAFLPAIAVAVIGPTAWAAVHKATPARWLAVLTAILFVLILFKIGDDANYEFIYFQF
ncbi:D-alanyl-lipoteichoic acid acyltransferase DltB, MBOAT superfamily [Bosea sp. CRIB-10]|uniref:MBOAT family O-acyltransferase n=1 Tax=Bosea sp. CRIB-10 TaxID=378404 RepID=UPI0008E7620B|nr:MBOAT family protein [Bosea sp. CRIB-10]SFD43003.1 D-alanyl-lipoteichoic acid acyltransferase DltB, MBOAT superfamily [Bosea sp. CRIB-10]